MISSAHNELFNGVYGLAWKTVGLFFNVLLFISIDYLKVEMMSHALLPY